jgi:hypothetical protein
VVYGLHSSEHIGVNVWGIFRGGVFGVLVFDENIIGGMMCGFDGRIVGGQRGKKPWFGCKPSRFAIKTSVNLIEQICLIVNKFEKHLSLC